MRVCINRKTGKLIELQSGGSKPEDLEPLIRNAVAGGHKAEDVEAKFISDEEGMALFEASVPTPSVDELRLRASRQEYSQEEFEAAVCEDKGGQPGKLQAIMAKRAAVDAKYPKE